MRGEARISEIKILLLRPSITICRNAAPERAHVGEHGSKVVCCLLGHESGVALGAQATVGCGVSSVVAKHEILGLPVHRLRLAKVAIERVERCDREGARPAAIMEHDECDEGKRWRSQGGARHPIGAGITRPCRRPSCHRRRCRRWAEEGGLHAQRRAGERRHGGR